MLIVNRDDTVYNKFKLYFGIFSYGVLNFYYEICIMTTSLKMKLNKLN